ncbi:hypothetical protein PTKIN_Ptkin12aG0070700 [Pterospermum kingtungense]
MHNFSSVLTLWVLVSIFANAAAIKKVFSANPKDDMIIHSSITDDTICKSLVQARGYVCEEHKVTTIDGYILSMQRIPVGRSGKTADKPPVLLQHGILLDAASWLLNTPEESLAYILADSGFDDYWEWSWDEFVQYEFTVLVQYVHDQTGQMLHYVGHSMGTLIALAAFSKQELLNMTRTAALLSPVAYLGQIPCQPVKLAAQLYLPEALYKLGFHEFPPPRDVLVPLLRKILSDCPDCSDLVTLLTGPNCCVNSSMVAELVKNDLQPTATKNLIHLSQMIRTGITAMYDYGNEVENKGHYRQSTPPAYNMKNIPKDLPLFLAYGGKDILADVNDVNSLLNDLKDHDKDKLVLVCIKDYAHLDFILGVNANQLVYDPIISFFKLH